MATTIQIEENTLKRLKYFKEYKKETYDEVVNKLMNNLEEGEISDIAFEGILRGVRDMQEGRVSSIQSVAKKLGIKIEE